MPLTAFLTAASPPAPANAPPAKARGTAMGPVAPKAPAVAIAPTTAPNRFLLVNSLNKPKYRTKIVVSEENHQISSLNQ